MTQLKGHMQKAGSPFENRPLTLVAGAGLNLRPLCYEKSARRLNRSHLWRPTCFYLRLDC